MVRGAMTPSLLLGAPSRLMQTIGQDERFLQVRNEMGEGLFPDALTWAAPAPSPRSARLLAGLASTLEQQLETAELTMHLVHIPDAGRGLVAARDIGQGEVVLCEAPLLATPSPHALACTCHYCLRPLRAVQGSAAAAAPAYCSDACASAAEAEFAGTAALADLRELEAACRQTGEKFPLLAARLACLLAQVRWRGEQPSSRDSSSSSSSSSRGDRSHASVWGQAAGRGDPASDLRHLCFANVRQPPQDWVDMHGLLQRGLAPLAAALGRKQQQQAAADWDAWLRSTFSLEFYSWALSRLHLNVFRVDTVPPLDQAADPGALLRAAAVAVSGDGAPTAGAGSGQAASPSGAAVYALASLLNHSCSPCLDVTFPANNALLQLVAARDITSGEQLTISYIDAEQPLEARQHALAFAYGFECRCSKCVEEAGGKELQRRQQHQLG